MNTTVGHCDCPLCGVGSDVRRNVKGKLYSYCDNCGMIQPNLQGGQEYYLANTRFDQKPVEPITKPVDPITKPVEPITKPVDQVSGKKSLIRGSDENSTGSGIMKNLIDWFNEDDEK